MSTLNTQAALDVLAERQRQMDVEGWTTEHDNTHSRGEMILAATAYATNASVRIRMAADGYPAERIDELSERASVPGVWPWARSEWKPSGSARRILVKAAALLIAEIERLDRASGG